MVSPVELLQPGVKQSYELEGPIAGVIAAQQLQDWMGAQDRSFRNNDLGYASDKNKYENALLDNSVMAAKRQVDLAGHQEEIDAFGSGRAQAAIQAKRDKEIQEALSKKTANEKMAIQMKADAVVAAHQEMEVDDGSDVAITARNRDRWNNDLYPKLAAQGIKVSPTYSPDVYKDITRKRVGAVQTITHMQALEQETLKGNLTQENTRISAAGHLASSKALAEGKATVTTENQPEDKRIQKAVHDAKVESRNTGKPIPYTLVQELASVYEEKQANADEQRVEADARRMENSLAISGKSKDSASDAAKWKKEEIQRRKNSWLAERLGDVEVGLPNNKVVKYKTDGTIIEVKKPQGVQSKPTAPSTTPTDSAVSTPTSDLPPKELYAGLTDEQQVYLLSNKFYVKNANGSFSTRDGKRVAWPNGKPKGVSEQGPEPQATPMSMNEMTGNPFMRPGL